MRQPLPDTSHKKRDNKMSRTLSQQIVKTNQSKISCISDAAIYFAHGILCTCMRNAVYLAQMKSFDFIVTFL